MGAGSLAAFKRQSRVGFLEGYGAFVCGMTGCRVCLSEGWAHALGIGEWEVAAMVEGDTNRPKGNLGP